MRLLVDLLEGKMEKVSIIIPVFNRKDNVKGAGYLKEAIDSALSQTYENIEVVVVNDGSEDDGKTEQLALSYGDKIKYIKKENGGVSSALNIGIKNATGDWISWLSHDDLYTPDKIKAQMADVEKVEKENRKNNMYYCIGGFIDADGKKLNKSIKKISEGLYCGTDILYKVLNGYGIGGCGLLIPKEMFENVGYFEEDMRYSQDWFMWVKAFIAGYGLYVNNNAMSLTRLHNMQTSTTGRQFMMRDREKTAEYMSKKLVGLTDTKNHNLMKEYMFLCFYNGIEVYGKKIYKELAKGKDVTFFDKCKLGIVKLKGLMRARLVLIYYKLVYGVDRNIK